MQQMNQQTSDIDVAFKILREVGEPLYFKDLIAKVLALKPRQTASTARAMADIHTQINLDSRFSYLGSGRWGLHQWKKGSRLQAEPEETNDEYDEEENEYDEQEVDDYAAETQNRGE